MAYKFTKKSEEEGGRGEMHCFGLIFEREEQNETSANVALVDIAHIFSYGSSEKADKSDTLRPETHRMHGLSHSNK